MLVSHLRTFLRPYERPIALVVLFQLVSTIASLYLPGLNAQIIDQGVVTGDTGYIVRTGVVMLGVTALQIVCSIAAVYYGARTAMALGRDLRESVFVLVESFAAQEVGRFGAPPLITRSANDIQQVQMLVLLTFTMMITAPIMCFGGDGPVSMGTCAKSQSVKSQRWLLRGRSRNHLCDFTGRCAQARAFSRVARWRNIQAALRVLQAIAQTRSCPVNAGPPPSSPARVGWRPSGVTPESIASWADVRTATSIIASTSPARASLLIPYPSQNARS